MMTLMTLLVLAMRAFVVPLGLGFALCADTTLAVVEPEQPEPTDGGISSADDLLRELERAGESVARFSASVRYVRTFAIAGDTETRDGSLVFVTDPADDGATPRRRFLIEFDRLTVGRRVEQKPQTYVFDGRWLLERLPSERQIVKREVVPPGERWDPLRLGEGPFPVPVGQRREDVLREFSAELLPAGDGLESEALRAYAADCWQLRLTPHPELAANADFEEVRVWYDRTDLLPRVVRTVSPSGDESLVQLREVRTNDAVRVDERAMSTDLPAKRDGWAIKVEPWQAK
ncbi:MAG: outer membrane lipoprotein carrier protein LolA [Phycisphaeraceae bacterium]|nr:outer membrane lipoprotein carrier protein LolA [Phycisphaeraceae bacterium]